MLASSFTRKVVLFSLLRLIVNIGIRMVSPFLAIFATGLGVDLVSMSLAVSASNSTSAISPLLAPVAERFGRKAGMLLGMALAVLGIGILAIWPTYPAFFAFLLLINLGNNIFSPTTQAYLGDLVPFEKRGLAISVNEMSWAVSFIAGMPLAGYLITRFGWQSPFWLLAALGVLALVLLLRLPSDRPAVQPAGGFFSTLGIVLRSPVARAALLLSVAVGCGVEIVTLMFGVWLKDSFSVSAVILGATSSVIGFSELGGEIAGGALIDRLGKKRAIAASIAANILVALALPLFRGSYVWVLAWLVLFFLTFEFTAVGAMTIMTELLPSARATLMSAFFSVFSLGVALGAVAAPWVYRAGFQANVLVGAACNLVALALLTQVKMNHLDS